MMTNSANGQPEGKTHKRLEFRGSGGSLFFLLLKNTIFMMLSFGLYAAWMRVDLRKFFWSNIYLENKPLQYTGTGLEIFIGYLKFLGIVFIGAIVLSIMMQIVGAGPTFVRIFLALASVPFAAIAAYSARRFLLSRTQYAGVSFSMSAGAREYAILCLKHLGLTLITLGLHYPVFANEKYSFKTNRTFYGKEKFQYTGSHKPLRAKFFWCWLLFIPTLSLSYYWYNAFEMSYFANNTKCGEAQFTAEYRGGDLLKYEFLTIFGVFASLGLLTPWIAAWRMRYFVGNYALVGQVQNVDSAEPNKQPSAISDQFTDVFGSVVG